MQDSKMYRLRGICEIVKFYQTANISFNLSDIGEGIREVVIKEWYVKVGDKVRQFDNICEVQSDKASVTITSRYDGTVLKLYYEIEETALVGKPLVEIETKDDTNGFGESLSSQESKNDAICIPSVRRLAKEHKIDLTCLKGTGKHGRILKEDVLKYLKSNKVHESETGEEKIVPIKGFQKAMMKSMTAALQIPHFIYSDEIIITKLSNIRRIINCETSDVNLSFMSLFIKAFSNALRRFPILNSQLDEKCENIIYQKHHNIGIAMDTQIGLAVPVIKNIENLNITEINQQLKKLMQSGKGGNFSMEDLSGATFTVSNIGSIGGTYMAPVILNPQVAIVALGKIKTQSKFDVSNNVVNEEILNVSAAADHRIIDGATMAKFINYFKKQIENPYLLFLNL